MDNTLHSVSSSIAAVATVALAANEAKLFLNIGTAVFKQAEPLDFGPALSWYVKPQWLPIIRKIIGKWEKRKYRQQVRFKSGQGCDVFTHSFRVVGNEIYSKCHDIGGRSITGKIRQVIWRNFDPKCVSANLDVALVDCANCLSCAFVTKSSEFQYLRNECLGDREKYIVGADMLSFYSPGLRELEKPRQTSVASLKKRKGAGCYQTCVYSHHCGNRDRVDQVNGVPLDDGRDHRGERIEFLSRFLNNQVNMNISRCEAVEVRTESVVWGGMVAIRSRRLYLNASEAEKLALSLIVAAAKVRDAEVRPKTLPLPLESEAPALEGFTTPAQRTA